MKFTDLLNEQLPTIDKSIIDLFLYTSNLTQQTHIYHLLTPSEAEHESIGDFYESLLVNSDKFIEYALGLNVDTSIWNETVYQNKLIFVYTKENLLNELDNYRKMITDTIERTNRSETMSINDVLIDIQKSIDILLYKLKQS